MTAFLVVVVLVIALAIGGTWYYSQASALPQSHYACVDNSCNLVTGSGASSCSSDADCAAVSSLTVTTLVTATTLAFTDPCIDDLKVSLATQDISACKTAVKSCMTALVYCEAAINDYECFKWFKNENVSAEKQSLCAYNIAMRNKDDSLCYHTFGDNNIACKAVHAKSPSLCNSLSDATAITNCKSLVAMFALDASLCDNAATPQCKVLVDYLSRNKK